MLANFEAVQFSANRVIKSDNLVQTLSPREVRMIVECYIHSHYHSHIFEFTILSSFILVHKMSCGLTYTQLLAIVDFILSEHGSSRTNCKRFFDRALYFLTTGPLTKAVGKNWSWSRFQEEVKNSEDGAYLFNFFLQREADMMGLGKDKNIADGDTTTTHAGTNTTAVDGVVKGGAGTIRVDPVRQALQVKVRAKSIDAFGAVTFHLKDRLKHINFIYDGKEGRRCWSRVFESDEEKNSIIMALQTLVEEFDYDLIFSE